MGRRAGLEVGYVPWLRLEVVFNSPQQGLALGGLIGEKIARGSKCK